MGNAILKIIPACRSSAVSVNANIAPRYGSFGQVRLGTVQSAFYFDKDRKWKVMFAAFRLAQNFNSLMLVSSHIGMLDYRED